MPIREERDRVASSTARRASRRTSVTGVDAWLLSLVANSTNQHIGEALSADELTIDQWRVLDYLAFDGPCTMSRLASATSINGATLTRLTDLLITRALVYRVADDLDRRRVLVQLSDRGRRTVRRARPKVLAAEAEATAELTDDEREGLRRLLQRIAPGIAATIQQQ